MKIKSISILAGPLVIGLVALFTLQAQSASVYAVAHVAEGNELGVYIIGPHVKITTPLEVVTQTASSEHGHQRGTLNFSGEATASAGYSTLHSAASGSLTNSYYDEFYELDTNNEIPTEYSAQGHSEFSQTLLYGGTANSYTSTYLLDLSGTIAGTGSAHVYISLTHAMAPPQTWIYFTEGD